MNRKDLAINSAPSVVRDFGLREAHAFPLVGARGRGGNFWSRRVPASQAWRYPYIQLSASANAFTALIFDCDQPEEAQYALIDHLPEPNWIVINPANGHMHVTYALSCPVHKYPEASANPIRWLRHIAEYFRFALSADPGYTGVLTRNPAPLICTEDTTEWHRKTPYDLRELDDAVPVNWAAPKISSTGVGRNVDLFIDLMKWAGRKENKDIPILTAATQRNREFDVLLPESEVRATARKISEYRMRWAEHGWHSPEWIQRQAARGRLSGKKRRGQSRDRDRKILKALESGMSVSEASRNWKLSRSTIRNIRDRWRMATNQHR